MLVSGSVKQLRWQQVAVQWTVSTSADVLDPQHLKLDEQGSLNIESRYRCSACPVKDYSVIFDADKSRADMPRPTHAYPKTAQPRIQPATKAKQRADLKSI